jgi:hypothetical protein
VLIAPGCDFACELFNGNGHLDGDSVTVIKGSASTFQEAPRGYGKICSIEQLKKQPIHHAPTQTSEESDQMVIKTVRHKKTW